MVFREILVLFVGVSLASGFSQLKFSMNAKVGERIQLPCRVPPKTPDSLIQWHLGTKQLTTGMFIMHYQSRLELFKPTPSEMTLIIKSVVKSDEAVFTCKSHDQVFAAITVHVQWKPEIVQQDSSKTQEVMVEGSTGELTCIASGQPQPNITWYRRPQDDPTFKPIGVTGEKLTIPKINRHGSDVYMCNASNVQGFATWEMNVTVHFPVEVYIYEPDMEVSVGERVIMTCVIQGSPIYSFYWMFGGTKIINNWKHLIQQDHNEGFPVYILTMMIRPRTLGDYDFGHYTCHADGSGFEDEASVELIQKKVEQQGDGPPIRYTK